MKRLTITTTRSGGSGSGKSFKEAYKNVDKAKYPTLEGFVKAAKEYKKKDVKVVEQIPTRKAEIITSSQPELRTIETVKEPESPPTIEKKKKTTKSRSRRPKPPRVKT